MTLAAPTNGAQVVALTTRHALWLPERTATTLPLRSTKAPEALVKLPMLRSVPVGVSMYSLPGAADSIMYMLPEAS